MNPALKRFLVQSHNFVFHGAADMPNSIGIELSTACNRRCHYCPQSVEPHKQQIITQHVWKTFLSRLREVEWRGIVMFHLYNEPTLVPNFSDYVADLKTWLPKCMPYLLSNGDKPEVIRAAFKAGLAKAIITEHPPFKEGWFESIETQLKEFGRRVEVNRLTDIHNHAGQVAVKCKPISRCLDHVGAMRISVDGDMLLCCLDYDRAHKFGNIADKSIRELWYSPEAKEARRLVGGGIPATPLCDGCFQTNVFNKVEERAIA